MHGIKHIFKCIQQIMNGKLIASSQPVTALKSEAIQSWICGESYEWFFMIVIVNITLETVNW